jgi:hypothetical protein
LAATAVVSRSGSDKLNLAICQVNGNQVELLREYILTVEYICISNYCPEYKLNRLAEKSTLTNVNTVNRKGKTNHHPESEILEKVREVLLKSDISQNEDWLFDDIMSLAIVSDESGFIYKIDTDEYDFTNDGNLEDESLLDDIDFGF